MMNRRNLLKALSALVLPGTLEDPERLNWYKCAKVFSFAPPLPDLPQGRGRLWSELIRTTETELIVKPSTEVMTSAMGLCTSSPGDTKS